MAENSSNFKPNNSVNTSSTYSELNDSSRSVSPRSLSPNTGWIIKYKTIPKRVESKGIWDGYQTKEEFMMMHLR